MGLWSAGVDSGLLVNQLRLATCLVDTAGRVIYWSPASERLFGFTAAEILGRDITQLLGSANLNPRPNFFALVESGVRCGVAQARCKDGSIRPVEWTADLMTLPDGQRVVVSVTHDLADLSGVLGGSAMLDAFFHHSRVGFVVVDVALRYVVVNEYLAGLNKRSVGDHIGRRMRDVLETIGIDAYEAALYEVLQTGEPIQDMRIIGAPTITGSNRVWSVWWSRIMDSYGAPIGLAGVIVDVTPETQHTLDTERSHRELAILDEAANRLNDSLNLTVIAQSLADIASTDFCDMVIVQVLEEVIQGGRLAVDLEMAPAVRCLAAASPIQPDLVAQFVDNGTYTAAPVFLDVLRADAPIRFDEVKPEMLPAFVTRHEIRDAIAGIGQFSLILAPLRARFQSLGVVAFARIRGKARFDATDMRLTDLLAGRAAVSLDNARLYQMEHTAAATLQRILQPERKPAPPEIALGYRYRPHHDSSEAGGDWFDVIGLPGRRVGILIGDVAGHGIVATALMGRYRTAAQTLAGLGLDPAAALTRLNELALDFGDEALATCLYLVYDPALGQCVYASAGHPPPIFVDSNGNVEVGAAPNGTLLGAPAARIYEMASKPVTVGGGVLVYTDGAAEHRGQPVDVGIARLRQVLRNGPVDDPEAVCDRIVAALPRDPADDITVLFGGFRGLGRD